MGDLTLHKKRLIVFVIGGITRSEVRTAYEISRATGRDVIIGSTSLDTPGEFLSQLTNLNTPVNSSSLMEDDEKMVPLEER
jgi:syntaxin-binding protein 1